MSATEQQPSVAEVLKHTPGPWRVTSADVYPSEGDTGRRFLEVIAGDECRVPADVHLSGYIDCGGKTICSVQFEPRDADARLIAAAPDLLEVLAKIGLLVEQVERTPNIAAHNIADVFRLYGAPAIAKATGQ